MSPNPRSSTPNKSQVSWQVFTGPAITVTLGADSEREWFWWSFSVVVSGKKVTRELRHFETSKGRLPSDDWHQSVLRGQPVTPLYIWKRASFNTALIKIYIAADSLRKETASDDYYDDYPYWESGPWLMQLVADKPDLLSEALAAATYVSRQRSLQRIDRFLTGSDKCTDNSFSAADLACDGMYRLSTASLNTWEISVPAPNGDLYTRLLMQAPDSSYGSNINLGWDWTVYDGKLCDPYKLWSSRSVGKNKRYVQVLVDKETPLGVPWILLPYKHDKKAVARVAACKKELERKCLQAEELAAGLQVAEARAKATGYRYTKAREALHASLAIIQAVDPAPSYAGSLAHSTAQRPRSSTLSAARGSPGTGMGPPPPYRAGRQGFGVSVSSA